MKAVKLASAATAALLSLALMACGAESSELEIASLTDGSGSGVQITAVNSNDEESSEGAITIKENDALVFDSMDNQTGKGTIHVTLTAPGSDKPAVDKDVPLSSFTSDVVEPGTYDLTVKCNNANGTLKIYTQNGDDLNEQNQKLIDDATESAKNNLDKTISETDEQTDGAATDANAATDAAGQN